MPSRPVAIFLSSGIATLAAGAVLWPVPYRDVNLPGNPSASALLCAAGISGIVAGCLMHPGVRAPVLSVAGGFVAAVLLRVVVETSRDPTSHNLWPFEVVILGAFGLVAGAAGTGLVRAFQRLSGWSGRR